MKIMSGSGSGIPSFYGKNEEVSCKNLVLVVALSTPVESALKKIEIGDNLEVVENTGTVQILNKDGEVAGTILSGYQPKLLECMEKANFNANVIEKKGGYCRVKITQL